MLKPYYIEVDGQIIRAEAKTKTESLTIFADLGHIVTYSDVKLVPAWEKEQNRKTSQNECH